MQQYRKREKFILSTAALLLCLVLVSFYMIGNLHAKYKTQASSSDSARVAKFTITENAGDLDQTKTLAISLAPGESKEYPVSVTSNSEVAVEYSIKAECEYKNLPLQFQMINSDGKEIESEEIPANDSTTRTYKLKVTWPETEKSPEYAGKTDMVAVTLQAVQKD